MGLLTGKQQKNYKSSALRLVGYQTMWEKGYRNCSTGFLAFNKGSIYSTTIKPIDNRKLLGKLGWTRIGLGWN